MLINWIFGLRSVANISCNIGTRQKLPINTIVNIIQKRPSRMRVYWTETEDKRDNISPQLGTERHLDSVG